MIAMDAAPAPVLLGKFALGYLAVLAAPGPNMLAVGALAALRGFRGVLPFCLGIALGVAALGTALQLLFGLLADASGMEHAARAIGGVLLLAVALRVMSAPCPQVAAARGAREGVAGDDLLGLLAGFCTAVTNPITAAYFAAQVLGPLADLPLRWASAPLAGVLAFAFGLLVAAVFARPQARRVVLRHHRAACVASGAALAGLAAVILLPLVRG